MSANANGGKIGDEQIRALLAAWDKTHRASHLALAEAAKLTGATNTLELGCNTGDLSRALCDRWPGLVNPAGLDRNEDAIAEFKRRFGEESAKVHDFNTDKPWDFPQGRFDLVMFSFLLEYLEPEYLCRLMYFSMLHAPRVLFCVYSYKEILKLFPQSIPGRHLIPGFGEPMQVGTEFMYRTLCSAGGFKQINRVGVVHFDVDPLLSIFSGVEASVVYLAER